MDDVNPSICVACRHTPEQHHNPKWLLGNNCDVEGCTCIGFTDATGEEVLAEAAQALKQIVADAYAYVQEERSDEGHEHLLESIARAAPLVEFL